VNWRNISVGLLWAAKWDLGPHENFVRSLEAISYVSWTSPHGLACQSKLTAKCISSCLGRLSRISLNRSKRRINIILHFAESIEENHGSPHRNIRIWDLIHIPSNANKIVVGSNWERGCSVGIATNYGMEDRGSIPGRNKFFSTLQNLHTVLWPTQLPIQWIPEVHSSRVKWPGCEANYSLPSSTEVKNGGAISSLPHTSSWRHA
jgi:hypothetical protein